MAKRTTRPDTRGTQLQLLEREPAQPSLQFRIEKHLPEMGIFQTQRTRSARKEAEVRTMDLGTTYVNGFGQAAQKTVEFRSACGLPTNADRDKYVALMKIIDDQKKRYGKITNPVRVSGYEILVGALQLSDGKENYTELMDFFERMVSTTIKSKWVIFDAARQVYRNDIVHIFDRVSEEVETEGRRARGRHEIYLADWLLENVNRHSTYSLGFNDYLDLKKPAARGIFLLLHKWFRQAGVGRIERDYGHVCDLIGINAYPHLSKAREVLSPSLDELVEIKALSGWEMTRRLTGDGFKIVFWAGDIIRATVLRRYIKSSTAAPENPAATAADGTGCAAGGKMLAPSHPTPDSVAASEAEIEIAARALEAMLALGVYRQAAEALLLRHDPDRILDLIAYLKSLVEADTAGQIGNPAGMFIVWLRQEMPIPEHFLCRLRSQALAPSPEGQGQDREDDAPASSATGISWQQQEAYSNWVDQQIDLEIAALFPGEELNRKLSRIISENLRNDPVFARITDRQRQNLARQLLAREVRGEITLPSMEQWIGQQKWDTQNSLTAAQATLFS